MPIPCKLHGAGDEALDKRKTRLDVQNGLPSLCSFVHQRGNELIDDALQSIRHRSAVVFLELGAQHKDVRTKNVDPQEAMGRPGKARKTER